ncbi:Clavaminate synthase-like protein [Peniophora sp. CONT]|nr:Clavaminate synthase-like protein [Peniophora sp. CONT]
MSTKSLSALPVIDISPWLSDTDTSHRLSVAASIHSACLEYGFFYLNISAIADASEPEELRRLAQEFFDLPQEEKLRLSIAHQDHARGYQRLKENVTNGLADNHEAIDFYRPVEEPNNERPLWGENQWPDWIPGFREKYEAWIAKMKRLGMAVMEAMAVGLGMSREEYESLRDQTDDSFWVMRIIGYPPLPEGADGFSCGAHKDYGCLTFLWADPTKNALQVFLPHGKSAVLVDNNNNSSVKEDQKGETIEDGVWISADPIPGCVVCNIGEMWEIWTNGLYKSTLHRVVHRGQNYRVSIPFFYEPNFTALVAPLPAALRIQDEAQIGHGDKTNDQVWPGKKYEPTVYGDFLMRKVDANFVPSREQSRAASREQSRAGSREASATRADDVAKA